MAKKKLVRVTLMRSTIGRNFKHKRTVTALGLRRIRHSVTHTDTPQIRGMIDQVRYLLHVEAL